MVQEIITDLLNVRELREIIQLQNHYNLTPEKDCTKGSDTHIFTRP